MYGYDHEGRLTWAWYRPASLTTQPCPSSTACSAFISLQQCHATLATAICRCLATFGEGRFELAWQLVPKAPSNIKHSSIQHHYMQKQAAIAFRSSCLLLLLLIAGGVLHMPVCALILPQGGCLRLFSNLSTILR